MSKRRGPDDRKRLDPEDVLAGRVKVGAAELLDLIHRVNPTGRELGAREAEVRYAQKARLQSLLIRRFGPELDVVPDPASEGTVSRRSRGAARRGGAARDQGQARGRRRPAPPGRAPLRGTGARQRAAGRGAPRRAPALGGGEASD